MRICFRLGASPGWSGRHSAAETRPPSSCICVMQKGFGGTGMDHRPRHCTSALGHTARHSCRRDCGGRRGCKADLVDEASATRAPSATCKIGRTISAAAFVVRNITGIWQVSGDFAVLQQITGLIQSVKLATIPLTPLGCSSESRRGLTTILNMNETVYGRI